MEKEEDVILKVSAGSPVNSLASAIAHSVYQQRNVTLRCIGAASVNQAIKGVAIANGYVGQKGLTLLVRPAFLTITLSGGDEVSAITLRVHVS